MAGNQKISVIGLGLMGAALAHRLIVAGHEVTVRNRTWSKRRRSPLRARPR
jgi:3-hydroxyisobutyrate dehydrogenase-like beta-hydroxyacid dehydrogenase